MSLQLQDTDLKNLLQYSETFSAVYQTVMMREKVKKRVLSLCIPAGTNSALFYNRQYLRMKKEVSNEMENRKSSARLTRVK